jgi:hypothetical protein
MRNLYERCDVRFGSLADICRAKSHVRFTPNCDRKSGFRTRSCLLYPRKRTCAVHLLMSALGQKRTSTWHPFFIPRQACSHILKTKLREALWSAWTDYSGATLVEREQENIMNIIEKSRETVEQLLARRNLPKTYEEKCQYALDLVDMHLHEENPDRIDECNQALYRGCHLENARSQR